MFGVVVVRHVDPVLAAEPFVDALDESRLDLRLLRPSSSFLSWPQHSSSSGASSGGKGILRFLRLGLALERLPRRGRQRQLVRQLGRRGNELRRHASRSLSRLLLPLHLDRDFGSGREALHQGKNSRAILNGGQAERFRARRFLGSLGVFGSFEPGSRADLHDAVAGLEPRDVGRALRVDVADLDARPRVVADRQDAEEGVDVGRGRAQQLDALELLLLVAARRPSRRSRRPRTSARGRAGASSSSGSSCRRSRGSCRRPGSPPGPRPSRAERRRSPAAALYTSVPCGVTPRRPRRRSCLSLSRGSTRRRLRAGRRSRSRRRTLDAGRLALGAGGHRDEHAEDAAVDRHERAAVVHRRDLGVGLDRLAPDAVDGADDARCSSTAGGRCRGRACGRAPAPTGPTSTSFFGNGVGGHRQRPFAVDLEQREHPRLVGGDDLRDEPLRLARGP